ncbi:MAG: hypothetical protein AAFS03_09040, partial [Pseudomonadota bacterium]
MFADICAITRALGGRWNGRQGSAPCPICQPEGRQDQRALSIGTGHDGRLLLFCHKAGCDFDSIAAALRDAGMRVVLTPASEAAAGQAEANRRGRERRMTCAMAAWRRGGPVRSTLAERYLRARCIHGDVSALRFDPECRHPSGVVLPAVIAPMIREGDGLVAVHRTFLAEPDRKA